MYFFQSQEHQTNLQYFYLFRNHSDHLFTFDFSSVSIGENCFSKIKLFLVAIFRACDEKEIEM